MACLGSPRVISTRLLQRCRAISWPPAAKLGGAPSWRLQYHRDPAKARDEQKRKGLNTHKQTSSVFFLVNPSILWLNPIWTKRGFNQPKIVVFSTWNRGIYQESWSTYETYGDIRKKTGIGTHVLQISGGWWNVQEKHGKTAWFVGQRIFVDFLNISERRYPL